MGSGSGSGSGSGESVVVGACFLPLLIDYFYLGNTEISLTHIRCLLLALPATHSQSVSVFEASFASSSSSSSSPSSPRGKRQKGGTEGNIEKDEYFWRHKQVSIRLVRVLGCLMEFALALETTELAACIDQILTECLLVSTAVEIFRVAETYGRVVVRDISLDFLAGVYSLLSLEERSQLDGVLTAEVWEKFTVPFLSESAFRKQFSLLKQQTPAALASTKVVDITGEPEGCHIDINDSSVADRSRYEIAVKGERIAATSIASSSSVSARGAIVDSAGAIDDKDSTDGADDEAADEGEEDGEDEDGEDEEDENDFPHGPGDEEACFNDEIGAACLPLHVFHNIVALPNDNVLVLGGRRESRQHSTQHLSLFNASSHRWSVVTVGGSVAPGKNGSTDFFCSMSALLSPLLRGHRTSHDSTVICIGGLNNGYDPSRNSSDDRGGATCAFFALDTETMTWSAPLAAPSDDDLDGRSPSSRFGASSLRGGGMEQRIAGLTRHVVVPFYSEYQFGSTMSESGYGFVSSTADARSLTTHMVVFGGDCSMQRQSMSNVYVLRCIRRLVRPAGRESAMAPVYNVGYQWSTPVVKGNAVPGVADHAAVSLYFPPAQGKTMMYTIQFCPWMRPLVMRNFSMACCLFDVQS
jgi:hypothetical protein